MTGASGGYYLMEIDAQMEHKRFNDDFYRVRDSLGRESEAYRMLLILWEKYQEVMAENATLRANKPLI